jgi:hypothetical protein
MRKTVKGAATTKEIRDQTKSEGRRTTTSAMAVREAAPPRPAFDEENFYKNLVIERDAVKALVGSLQQSAYAPNRLEELKHHTEAQSSLRFLLKIQTLHNISATGARYKRLLEQEEVFGLAQDYEKAKADQPNQPLAVKLLLALYGVVHSSDSVPAPQWRRAVADVTENDPWH